MKGPSLIPRGSRPPLWREARVGLEAAALLRDPIRKREAWADLLALKERLDAR